MEVPDREHLAVAGVVEQVAGPALLHVRDGLDPHELEAHGLGVEAVGRVEVAGGDGDVVKSHAPIVAPSRRSGTVDSCVTDAASPDSRVGRCRSDRPVPALVRRSRGGRSPPARRDDPGHRDARGRRFRPGRCCCGVSTSAGFAFFTNLESAKGLELAANPRAALVFHWREQERQVRVVGAVERVDDAEAARYWESRPRGHRLSAWASPQSRVVDDAELHGAGRRGRSAFAGRTRRSRRSGAASSSASTSSSAGRADPIACTTACATADGRGGWQRERLAP